MKSMVLTGIRQMEMRDMPIPELSRDTDVRLKIFTVGVCGSDIHYYHTGRIGSQVVKYPFTVGHECAAVVETVGAAVKNLKPGDRVAVEPAISCWQCDQCRASRPHTCRKLRFLGCPGQAEGCLSEFLVMPQECCLRIAPSMTFEQATLSEPLAIGLYAARQSIALKGARIGILGAGPIGLSVMVCARAMGAERIYVTDKIDRRLDVARRHGADWVGNPGTIPVVEAVTETEPLLLDAVFECCGEPEAIDHAVDILKPGGKLMLIGIPTVDRVAFIIDRARRKELCIQNVRRQNHCAQATLSLMGQGFLTADFMVTHRFSFEQTQQAFDLVGAYQDGVVKAMIQIG